MRSDALIFDLDGTLWDTSKTCAAAWNRVVRGLGIDYRDVTAADMRAVAGLSHIDAVRRVFVDVSEADVARSSIATQKPENLPIWRGSSPRDYSTRSRRTVQSLLAPHYDVSGVGVSLGAGAAATDAPAVACCSSKPAMRMRRLACTR